MGTEYGTAPPWYGPGRVPRLTALAAPGRPARLDGRSIDPAGDRPALARQRSPDRHARPGRSVSRETGLHRGQPGGRSVKAERARRANVRPSEDHSSHHPTGVLPWIHTK